EKKERFTLAPVLHIVSRTSTHFKCCGIVGRQKDALLTGTNVSDLREGILATRLVPAAGCYLSVRARDFSRLDLTSAILHYDSCVFKGGRMSVIGRDVMERGAPPWGFEAPSARE
ncbi:hypothetical protein KUCAC02_027964, partial [Chaenocephalus aceratus]